MDFFLPVVGKVYCIFSVDNESNKNLCNINQTIDSEDFFLSSPRNPSIEMFQPIERTQLKFLPSDIGEKFPNLVKFRVVSSGLTIVRDFYFKDMEKLIKLDLSKNQIKTIEPEAFDDLVNLHELSLWDNKIETLDKNLFVNLVNLSTISLGKNKIKLLHPSTFIIPGNGKLWSVDLRNNVCISEEYGGSMFVSSSPLNQLKSDLGSLCFPRLKCNQ